MTTITQGWAAGRAERRNRTAREPILGKLARTIARKLPTWQRTRTTLYTFAGLGLVDYAVWEWQPLIGYATAGLSLLILEWAGRE